MTLALYGLGVSRGIAIGKAHVLVRDELTIKEYHIAPGALDQEVERFGEALETARAQLHEIRDHVPTATPVDIKSFIDTHLLMLDDAALAQVPIDIIRIRKCNAEWALKLQRDALVRVFDEMEDPYLRTRKDDVNYVVDRVQRVLLKQTVHPDATGDNPLQDAIVLADDLSPADTVLMQHQGVAGFVTEFGGTTSHTAILARSLGIPALVGVHNARRFLKHDEVLIVDGREGTLLAGPDEPTIDFFRRRKREQTADIRALETLAGRPAITLDDCKITLYANIELPEDLVASKKFAAEGVGLYRTELLFMNRSELPDEEEQYQDYVKVLQALDGAPITIRTLDIGADKLLTGHHREQGMTTNPALSMRGIRWSLREPAVFRGQLRAILRASAHGPVRMMIPMLSNTRELVPFFHLLAEIKRELRAEGMAFNQNMAVGGMIEVPAAALTATAFARQLDFLSIGTNDLIQYTVAADRIDDTVNYLYDPLHPAVLRLIKMTIDAGVEAGVPVTLCGEMAGEVRFTRLLLGLGLTEFSMHPASLLEVKRLITESNVTELRQQVTAALASGELAQITALVEQLNASHL
jgi:phosphotransferase system enzyme I (PtsI)